MAERVAVGVTVQGAVQGVFFRAGCRDLARSLGVAGWVHNEPDGSVSGRFEGDPEAVGRLVEWCRTGPPGARVDRVDAVDREPTGERSFRIRR